MHFAMQSAGWVEEREASVKWNTNAMWRVGKTVRVVLMCVVLAVGIGRECPGADDERVADETDRFG